MKLYELENKLKLVFGSTEGQRLYQTIIPGILADFLKMYSAASPGRTVKEEYRLEDGSGIIILEADRTAGPADIRAEFRR